MYKVGLYDSDYYYCVKLMEHINTQNKFPIRATVFSTEEAVGEYLKKYKLDALITCKIFLGYDVEQINFLEEETCNRDGIYKYQNIKGICNDIAQRVCNLKQFEYTQCVMYGVYAPLGRCGKTELAMMLARMHPNSLYICFEEFTALHVTDNMLTRGEKFLYYLISMNEEILSVIEDYELIEGIRVIIPSVTYVDVRQVTVEHIIWFKKLVTSKMKNTSFVFDIGVGALADLSILEKMDVVFVPVLFDASSEKKLSKFVTLLGENPCEIKYVTLDNDVEPFKNWECNVVAAKELLEGGEFVLGNWS